MSRPRRCRLRRFLMLGGWVGGVCWYWSCMPKAWPVVMEQQQQQQHQAPLTASIFVRSGDKWKEAGLRTAQEHFDWISYHSLIAVQAGRIVFREAKRRMPRALAHSHSRRICFSVVAGNNLSCPDLIRNAQGLEPDPILSFANFLSTAQVCGFIPCAGERTYAHRPRMQQSCTLTRL